MTEALRIPTAGSRARGVAASVIWAAEEAERNKIVDYIRDGYSFEGAIDHIADPATVRVDRAAANLRKKIANPFRAPPKT